MVEVVISIGFCCVLLYVLKKERAAGISGQLHDVWP